MNILIFGPNGSGKGTQGAIVQKKFDIAHVESGGIFRDHIKGGTELGQQARAYIERGDLVPDELTIPMVLESLSEHPKGWLLDGFPRSLPQAEALEQALRKANIALDYVIEIHLDRELAKQRIMGRRICVADNNHPNHIAFPEIQPKIENGRQVCRMCGDELTLRPDDQDEQAINKRHDIYYDETEGTMAAVRYFSNQTGPKVIRVDGSPTIREVYEAIMAELD